MISLIVIMVDYGLVLTTESVLSMENANVKRDLVGIIVLIVKINI